MGDAQRRDYRTTLNLPTTSFPMQAELAKREPARVAWWREQRTFERCLERNESALPWILHDGPPYANGELHMGHFLNMVLKDVFVKIALLDGKWAKFVPGWDMHGLPIELETLKYLGIADFHAVDALELRARCKERAIYWFERQRDVRMRMGVFADYDHAYRTIDPSYEAVIVDTLADLAERDQIYKGLRATLWCWHDETALAEAEIEYENRTSPSIFVRFPFDERQRDALASVLGVDLPREKTAVVVWTTTPWTLPGNSGVALHPDAAYALYDLGDEALLVAEALAQATLGQRYAAAKKIASTTGRNLRGLRARNPLFDRDSEIVLAEYVDLETGTGAVHTAPGHGAEDFETGTANGLAVRNPVDAAGHFTAEAGPYAGMQIFDANATIVGDLRANGTLLRAQEIVHSYPHCWRCHNPVIFRATSQWFIAMDRNDLRARALDATNGVTYTPQWGRERQRQMIERHPEWCISRQRTWGTPIPAVTCLACAQSVLDPVVARNAARRFAQVGADAWWRDAVATYLPAGFACPSCGGTAFAAERDIVDIWFESGVTHLAVLGHDGLPWPCDAVVEGGDQYRGWFRSSLVIAAALRGEAPYRHVVKNGWVNDEEGRAMSKSRGTGIDARDAMDRYGADVLRLWAASVEFVDDVRFGPNVVAQVGRVYRNVRNRIRFMLGNIGDLAPEAIVERAGLPPLDALADEYAAEKFGEIADSYDVADIHGAYLAIVELESGLSALYFDAVKDPLYSRAAGDPRRRAAQSVLFRILRGFLAAVAPVLSFTAEEAWQAVPEPLRAQAGSVFDLRFVRAIARDAGAAQQWAALRALRAAVAANAEYRDFEAKAIVQMSPEQRERLARFGDEDLREALVVSQIEIRLSNTHATAPTVGIVAAEGEKCARCWKYRQLGGDAAHPSICDECAVVVRAFESRAR
jgi:isoleucyl-tRNA synthetase